MRESTTYAARWRLLRLVLACPCSTSPSSWVIKRPPLLRRFMRGPKTRHSEMRRTQQRLHWPRPSHPRRRTVSGRRKGAAMDAKVAFRILRKSGCGYVRKSNGEPYKPGDESGVGYDASIDEECSRVAVKLLSHIDQWSDGKVENLP